MTPSYPSAEIGSASAAIMANLAKALEIVEPKLKVHIGIELKHKVDFVYLLKDKSDNEMVYVAKGKDVMVPHTVYDVITGDETNINFDVIAGAAGSESVEKPIEAKDIKPIITRPPAEAIVVLIDISGSMGGRFFNETDLNRMGAVKSFFEAFAYRTMAYNMEHVISLIFFDTIVEVKIDFTESFHDFNLLVANAAPRGGTNLYDAIVTACDRLTAFRTKYPDCIMRILALTDGEDTGSRSNIQATATRVLNDNIILDSFVVGTNCEGLKSITYAAGGKCYLSRTLDEGLKLFEQETVISYRSRKVEERPIYSNVAELIERTKLIPFDLPNSIHAFKLPDIQKPAVDTKKLAEELKTNPNKMGSTGGASMKRIMKEFQNYQNDPHPFVSIYPCGDMTLWKMLLYGPSKTPYEGGLYLMYAQFPTEYPFKPPTVRFITPIYHCNMNSQGRICHSVFDRNYSPALSFRNIIDAVYGLILTPEPDDPLDNVIASYYLSNYEQYEKNAVNATKSQANKSPEEIVEELFGKIADDNQRQEKVQNIRNWIKKAESSN